MRRYRIRYRDDSPESPTFSLILRAHNREHAEERFLDSDDDGWIILSIDPAPEVSPPWQMGGAR